MSYFIRLIFFRNNPLPPSPTTNKYLRKKRKKLRILRTERELQYRNWNVAARYFSEEKGK